MADEKNSWWQKWWKQRRAKSFRLSSLQHPTIKTVTLSKTILLALTSSAIFLSMTPPQLLTPVPFVEGDTFPYDIRAHQFVRYISKSETERRRQQATDSVSKVYKLDRSVSARLTAVLNDLFDTISNLQHNSSPLEEKLTKLKQRFVLVVPDRVFAIFLEASPSTIQFLKTSFIPLLQKEWQKGIKPIKEEKISAINRVKMHIDRLPLTYEYKFALKQLSEVALQPNMNFDPIATEIAKEQAKNSVKPVYHTIRPGDLIARKGELVKPSHLEKFEAMGYNFPALIGIFLLSLLVTIGTAVSLKKLSPEIYSNGQSLFLLVLIWLPWLLTIRFSSPMTGNELAFPLISTASMTTALLMKSIVSVFASIVTALIVTLSTMITWQEAMVSQLNLFLVSIALGTSASFLCSDLRSRAQLVQSGMFLGLLSIIIQIIVGMVTGDTFVMGWNNWQKLFIWSTLTGVLPPTLTLVEVSVLERLFGLTTVFTLLELSSPHSPILRELAEKAPGTFQSALMVARLAQEAARRIQANDLLAWTGALYHDIGKIQRPGYFVENLPVGSPNPHDFLSPQMSAKVLALHVEQGEEIARKYRLPVDVVNIIREHHGNMTMSYFLAKAKEKGESVDEEVYRYKGPKPISKESAIVMLADSVEAAVRTLNSADPEKIEQVTQQVISDRISERQLEDANLSLSEIQSIKKAFVDTLKSIYHQRIEYPKLESEKHSHTNQRNGGQNRPISTVKADSSQE